MTSSQYNSYLPPLNSQSYDKKLETTLNNWISNITRLSPNLIRPRWQPVQPSQPDANVNWCAIGIYELKSTGNPALIQSDESSVLERHEYITVLASFYGPGSQGYASMLRDGVEVSQNNDQLVVVGMTFGECDRIIPAAELINNQWVRRYDLRVALRRKISREYNVKTLLSASVQYFGD